MSKIRGLLKKEAGSGAVAAREGAPGNWRTTATINRAPGRFGPGQPLAQGDDSQFYEREMAVDMIAFLLIRPQHESLGLSSIARIPTCQDRG